MVKAGEKGLEPFVGCLAGWAKGGDGGDEELDATGHDSQADDDLPAGWIVREVHHSEGSGTTTRSWMFAFSFDWIEEMVEVEKKSRRGGSSTPSVLVKGFSGWFEKSWKPTRSWGSGLASPRRP